MPTTDTGLSVTKPTEYLVNVLQVGPIAEEVVFRGCSIPLLLGAGVERTRIIWLSPLMFGFGEFAKPHSLNDLLSALITAGCRFEKERRAQIIIITCTLW